MREIRFRARAVNGKGTGDWVYGLYVKQHSHFCIVDDIGVETVIDPTTLGQYTGLKDKSGTPIFEGDIVIRFDIKGIVQFGNRALYNEDDDYVSHPSTPCFFIAAFGETDDDDLGYAIYGAWEAEPEVIGNIHENKDLLK